MATKRHERYEEIRVGGSSVMVAMRLVYSYFKDEP